MYKDFFGLKEFPFSIAPDPRYLYMSEQHKEALAHLLYGINSDGGFVLLTGEVGTGKTTVCRCLLEKIPEDINIAFILNPKLTVEELLALICDELRIQYPKGNKSIKVFIDCINRYLLDEHSKGCKTVLIIEEAQNLSSEVLEQIRLLTNLETNQKKLLQIIMIGQPELRDKLSQPELKQLSQRITARYHIGPLSCYEIKNYVNHRLSVAGTHRILFPDSIINTLYKLSGGIPRCINLICDRALLGSYTQGHEKVNKSTLTKASKEVLGENMTKWKYNELFKWLSGIIITIALVATFASTLIKSNSEKQIVNPLQSEKNQDISELKWTSDQPINKSKQMAYQSLFAKWGHTYNPDTGNACKQAHGVGLGCLDIHGSLDSIIQLNRPAILKLFDSQGNKFYATLIEIKGKKASFIIGTETKSFDIKDIAMHWSGDYTIFWRIPPDYRGYIKRGSKGQIVKWLKKQLSIIKGTQFQNDNKDVFDDSLEKQIKEFQLVNGLVPDGIVGPQTIIHLNSLINNNNPKLTNKETGI